MAGLFDDLIPAQAAPAQGAMPAAANPFSDLIPAAAPSVPLPQSRPPQQTTFDKLVGINGPRYQTWPERAARGLYSSIEDAVTLPHDVVQEAQQPAPAQISDSDVSRLSVPSAVNFAAMTTPVNPSVRSGDAAIPGQAIAAAPGSPSIPQLEASSSAAYEHPDVTSLRLDPSVGPKLVNQVKSELIQNKLDPINAGSVINTVSNLGKARFEQPQSQSQTVLAGPGYHIADDVQQAAPLQVADIDLTRRSLSDVPFDQQRAAGIARNVLDNYLGGNIPPGDVISGDAAAANAKLLSARGDWAAAQRAREVDRLQHNAEIQAGSTYSGGNLNNATRQQLKQLLRVQKGQRQFIPQGWTQGETDQLRNAVVGTPVGNAARLIGKLGPDGKLGLISHLIAAKETGGASIPFSVAAIGAKAIGNASEANQVSLLANMIRARSPLAQSMQAAQPVLKQPSSAVQRIAAVLAARNPSSSGAVIPGYFGAGARWPFGINNLPAYADSQQQN